MTAAAAAAALEPFFDRASDAFARAAPGAGGVVERSIHVAGRTARLTFAGKAFVDAVMPALAHLETTGGDDALTIACNPGAIRAMRVQRAGKPAMDAAELLRGRAVPEGTRLA